MTKIVFILSLFTVVSCTTTHTNTSRTGMVLCGGAFYLDRAATEEDLKELTSWAYQYCSQKYFHTCLIGNSKALKDKLHVAVVDQDMCIISWKLCPSTVHQVFRDICKE